MLAGILRNHTPIDVFDLYIIFEDHLTILMYVIKTFCYLYFSKIVVIIIYGFSKEKCSYSFSFQTIDTRTHLRRSIADRTDVPRVEWNWNRYRWFIGLNERSRAHMPNVCMCQCIGLTRCDALWTLMYVDNRKICITRISLNPYWNEHMSAHTMHIRYTYMNEYLNHHFLHAL